MKTDQWILCTVITLCFWGLPVDASIKIPADPANQELRAWLEPISQVSVSDDADVIDESLIRLARFYKALKFRLVWINGDGLRPQGLKAMEILRQASQEEFLGLKEQLNHFEQMLADGMRLNDFGLSLPPVELVRLDISLTHIMMQYTTGLLQKNLETDVGAASKEKIICAGLARSLEENCLEALLAAIQPQHAQYKALIAGLNQYEAIRILGGWPKIADGPSLRIGQRDSRVPMLRWRLTISGDMRLDQLSAKDIYDRAIADGIRNFQRRHGIKADGVIGKITLLTLNMPVEDRIWQIKANIERWRNLSVDLGPRYLMVNIPNYQLDIFENNTVVKSMRAIVGKTDRRTPVLSSMMTYLELNPYWNVPQKIACKDFFPKIMDNPEFLIKQKIQVFENWEEGARELDPLSIDWDRFSNGYFPFRLRQKPDRYNALGRVKFIFSNPFSVYIHDTPSKALFKKQRRSYSSGCIRIEKPMQLAEYLLKNQLWDRNRINDIVKTKKRKIIVLKQPIPVHLVYFTSWKDSSGTMHFREDLYNRDDELIHKMATSNSTTEMTSCTLFDLLDLLVKIECGPIPSWLSIANSGKKKFFLCRPTAEAFGFAQK